MAGRGEIAGYLAESDWPVISCPSAGVRWSRILWGFGLTSCTYVNYK